MASQDSIKTEASDVPPPGSGSGAPASAGEWDLPFDSAFPSPENPKYIIKAEIDDGGMGVVYEALQGSLGVVAIKVIKPRILGQAASERFLNEARAMAKVRSEPGIATIFDCDWYTDRATGTRAPYIVMEYIGGAVPITTYAAEHRLGLRGRLDLFGKVCAAMGAAHRADIVHRDLKPANIMVDAAGHPKVIDFGLAVVREPTEHAKSLPSERGGLFGTLDYMSPEQAAKRFDPHVLTSASDVYSLGVILYELLMGKLPYEHQPSAAVKRFEDRPPDYTEATRVIREDAPLRPGRLNLSVHPGVEAILLKALEKDPARRYRTAGEMGEAIERHLRSSLRRDVARCAPIVLAALILAHVLGIPALFRWTGVNDAYQRLAGIVAPSVERLEHVVLVTGDEETDIKAFPLGVQTPPEGLGMGAGERMRPLWAAVCRHLAESGCRVVALDLLFDLDSTKVPSDDDVLISSLESLKSKGIECVLGSPEWEDELGLRSRVMSVPDTKLGAVWMHAGETAWMIETGVSRNNTVLPSFSLQAAAAWLHPGKDVIFDLAEQSFEVRMTTSERGQKRWHSDPQKIPMSRFVYGNDEDISQTPVDSIDTYGPDDKVALLHLKFPAQRAFDDARIDAGNLLRLSASELKTLCRDKVVVLAGQHVSFADEFAMTPDGRRLPKSYGHTLAIETMLQRTPTIRGPGAEGEELVTLAAALLGASLALVFPGRFWACAWAGVGAAALLTGVSLLALNQWALMINPVVPGVALVLATLGTAGVPELLRRFRA